MTATNHLAIERYWQIVAGAACFLSAAAFAWIAIAAAQWFQAQEESSRRWHEGQLAREEIWLQRADDQLRREEELVLLAQELHKELTLATGDVRPIDVRRDVLAEIEKIKADLRVKPWEVQSEVRALKEQIEQATDTVSGEEFRAFLKANPQLQNPNDKD